MDEAKYLQFLQLHGRLLWPVLGLTGLTLLVFILGVLVPLRYRLIFRVLALGTATIININFVVGWLLYFLSPRIRPVFDNPAVVQDSWVNLKVMLLHPLLTIAAALLSQWVYARVKQGEKLGLAFRRGAVGFAIILALLLLAVYL